MSTGKFTLGGLVSNAIPAGTYRVTVVDAKFKTGKDGATTNDIVLNLAINGGAYDKKVVIDTIYEKAAFRLKPLIKALGLDLAREFSSNKEAYEYVIAAAKGKTLMAEIKIRTYAGSEYNDIANYTALAGSTTTDREALEALKVAAPTEASTPRVDDLPDPTGTVDEVADIDDSELPF